MPAIRLQFNTDHVCGDDFERGRKLLANIIKTLPATVGMDKLVRGQYCSGFRFDVDPKTLEIRPAEPFKRENTVVLTVTVDEL